jgi:hypothetical protein
VVRAHPHAHSLVIWLINRGVNVDRQDVSLIGSSMRVRIPSPLQSFNRLNEVQLERSLAGYSRDNRQVRLQKSPLKKSGAVREGSPTRAMDYTGTGFPEE